MAARRCCDSISIKACFHKKTRQEMLRSSWRGLNCPGTQPALSAADSMGCGYENGTPARETETLVGTLVRHRPDLFVRRLAVAQEIHSGGCRPACSVPFD